MSASPPPSNPKLLPGVAGPSAGAAADRAIVAATAPSRQLAELPKDELEHFAEEYGLDPTRYKTRQHLVAALHERRQLIASMDRDAMLDCVRWGRRPVTVNATKDQIAQEIARIHSMRFAGLSQRGLCVLCQMRGIEARDNDDVPALVKRLKKQEGFFSRMNRKRRSVIAGLVANMVGEAESAADYQFLPPAGGGGTGATGTTGGAARDASIKEEIEDAGLFGGITNRLKKTADSYVNQKLDEIEARIDRKLDEIDRRLGEWRDKEVANRIKILKITLWASVIVGLFSLIYSYVVVYFFPGGRTTPSAAPERRAVPQVVAPPR